jgi:hypothetical protein
VRCVKLFQASEILLRRIIPEAPQVKAMGAIKGFHLQALNLGSFKEPDLAECQKIISEIMSKEPDPFSGDIVYSR